MTSRLEHLESLLAEYNDRLADYERQLLRYERLEHPRIKLLIRDLREAMLPVEEERWQILATHSTQLDVSEAEAEVIVGELVTQVNQLETTLTADQDADMLRVLQALLAKLEAPEVSSPDKVKVAISSFPPFVKVFYQTDLESLPKSFGGFCQQYFPTFTGGAEKLAGLLRAQPKK
ncbi:hypothetical protein [Halomicronema sp. CCY15110]|uniref:hypothetical protein n=1 Tax=Halomicronema sp. CCY15110 TaxID=2767773 RepID=UPI00194FBDF7|nr:hypothetical protein [Halomicronema sp. CCY15110]